MLLQNKLCTRVVRRNSQTDGSRLKPPTSANRVHYRCHRNVAVRRACCIVWSSSFTLVC